MNKSCREYCDKHGLSPREAEVFYALTNGQTSIKDLSKFLELSPNTVANHLKRIFEKTQSASRTALLAKYLHFLNESAKNCDTWCRRPRVLVIDDEAAVTEMIATELTERGFRVFPYTDPVEAMKDLPTLPLDAIVADIRMPDLDGIEFLRKVRETNHYFPSVIFVSGNSGLYPNEKVMDMGAAGVIGKPIDFDRLFDLIVGSLGEGGCALDTKTHEHVKEKSAPVLNLEVDGVGFGGVFIKATGAGDGKTPLEKAEVGSLIHLRFPLPDFNRPIEARGEVVWRRNATDMEGAAPGIGVKFLNLNHDDRDALLDYVRMNKILNFIPRV